LFILSNSALKRKFNRVKLRYLDFKQTYRVFFNTEYLHELNQTFEMRALIKSEMELGKTFLLLGKIKQSSHHFGKASNLIKIFDDKLSLNRIQILNYYGSSVMRLHDFKYGNYQVNLVFDDIQEIFSDCFETCAMTYNNLAVLSHKLQKDAAIYYYLKAASIYNRVKGRNNLMSIKIYNSLAEFYFDRRQYERSLELLALSLSCLSNSTHYPIIATLYAKQAFVQFKLNNVQEAKRLFRTSEDIFKEFGFMEDSHIFIAEVLHGKFYLELKDYGKAFKIFQALQERCQKIWKEVHCSVFLCYLLQLKALQLWVPSHDDPDFIEAEEARRVQKVADYLSSHQTLKKRYGLKRVIFRMQEEGVFYNGLAFPFKFLRELFDLEVDGQSLLVIRATITLLEFYTA